MSNVAYVLKDKGNTAIYTVKPNSTVLDAIKLMADKGIGALVVRGGPTCLNN